MGEPQKIKIMFHFYNMGEGVAQNFPTSKAYIAGENVYRYELTSRPPQTLALPKEWHDTSHQAVIEGRRSSTFF